MISIYQEPLRYRHLTQLYALYKFTFLITYLQRSSATAFYVMQLCYYA